MVRPTPRLLTPNDDLQSAPEEPHDDCEHDAEQEAGDDRKLEREVLLLDGDIAREPTEWAEPAEFPNQRADNGEQQSRDDHEFPDVLHASLLAGTIQLVASSDAQRIWLVCKA